jgi:asparagine synthase (glutamine-hydrolysing)
LSYKVDDENMCGITAIWGEDDRILIAEMMESLIHRGPDASGIVSQRFSTLGHRRLSIMDPEGGRQPILNEDGDISIVVNGEIYNFHALKDELKERHRFSTSSDSEVPVHLFEEVAQKMVERLDGMFAIILTDGHELLAARDPIGIKPLYYGESGRKIVFASELKALSGRATNVREFPPGSFYHTQSGFQKYRHIPRCEPEERSIEYWCHAIRNTLEHAVTKRLMSDVPLGAFLSGGLDSSIIAAIARSHIKELHTFSVGIEGSRDLDAARVVSRHIESIHHEYVFSKDDILHHLPEIIFFLESFDQDLVRSAVPCFFVSRLASKYVKVILTGEGADELFGGYSYYKDFNDTMPLHEELYRSVSSLHNINLQRVDRLTMAHSIEGRVPFLDLEMIELGQRIPSELKIRQTDNGPHVEKWILRKAFEDLLPTEIVWRTKEQFDEGSGTSEVLAGIGDHFMTKECARDYSDLHLRDRIRGHEESVYHKLLCEAYADSSTILSNVGRWQDNRIHKLPNKPDARDD